MIDCPCLTRPGKRHAQLSYLLSVKEQVVDDKSKGAKIKADFKDSAPLAKLRSDKARSKSEDCACAAKCCATCLPKFSINILGVKSGLTNHCPVEYL